MKQPSAIVCLTGSELTRGETDDRNGPFLASALTSLGFRVEELRLVRDDPRQLAEAFRDCARRADLLVVSGGLGPTADDCTVRALAEVLGRGIRRDPAASERMRQRALARLGSEELIPANFYKQSEVLEGSTVLPNPVGLAPGFIVESERGLIAVMPGVPAELKALFRKLAAPAIRERFRLSPSRCLRARIMGVPESLAEERIQTLGIDFERAEYGIGARPGELTVRFLAHRPADHAYLDEVRRLLEEEFLADLIVLPEGSAYPSSDERALEHSRIVHDLLVATGLTVAAAESCTGGLVAKRLTDHSGSSAYFLGSVVAYHNAVKERLLDVGRALLEEHGAVSAEVCRAMALGVKKRLGSDYGLAVTGIAGPGGGSVEKPVGLVYVGLATPGPPSERGDEVTVVENRFPGARDAVRRYTAVRCLDLLRRDLEDRRARRERAPPPRS